MTSSPQDSAAVAKTPEGPEQPADSVIVKIEAEEYVLIETGAKKLSRRVKAIDDDEPLVDTTVALPKRSKKTERATKRLMKKQQKASQRRGPASFSDLPPELLEDILNYLRASDILRLLTVSRSVHDFISTNESAIARSIIRRRYTVLSNCFPLPKLFSSVPESTRPALLSEARQSLLQIHKRPYQHVQPIDPEKICTCMTCMLAWNNLNMIVDLAHWQRNLNSREPIPMIPRGANPQWNQDILAANAALVEKAMTRPIFYTLILQRHLETTIGTLLRTLRGQKTVHPKRVYYLSKLQVEAGIETDAFLEKNGPECHEFPFHRDNYYNLNAYVPNRKWSRGEGKWKYYPDGAHERDLQWVRERFVPDALATGTSHRAERKVEKMESEEKEKEKALDGFAAQFRAQAKLGKVAGGRGQKS